MAISSSREKPRRRAAKAVKASITASSAPSTIASTSKLDSRQRDHMPDSVAALIAP